MQESYPQLKHALNLFPVYLDPEYKVKVRLSLQAGAYLGFSSTERLPGVFLLPLDGMLVHHRVNPNIKFAGTILFMERGTVRGKCLV